MRDWRGYLEKIRQRLNEGGPGSGHHGHVGRPGQRGGSLPAGEEGGGSGVEGPPPHEDPARLNAAKSDIAGVLGLPADKLEVKDLSSISRKMKQIVYSETPGKPLAEIDVEFDDRTGKWKVSGVSDTIYNHYFTSELRHLSGGVGDGDKRDSKGVPESDGLEVLRSKVENILGLPPGKLEVTVGSKGDAGVLYVMGSKHPVVTINVDWFDAKRHGESGGGWRVTGLPSTIANWYWKDLMKVGEETMRGHWREYLGLVRERLLEGGPGSGNFGHAGRPGEVGGSAPSDEGGSSDTNKIDEVPSLEVMYRAGNKGLAILDDDPEVIRCFRMFKNPVEGAFGKAYEVKDKFDTYRGFEAIKFKNRENGKVVWGFRRVIPVLNRNEDNELWVFGSKYDEDAAGKVMVQNPFKG